MSETRGFQLRLQIQIFSGIHQHRCVFFSRSSEYLRKNVLQSGCDDKSVYITDTRMIKIMDSGIKAGWRLD